jgi:hypothetical protein
MAAKKTKRRTTGGKTKRGGAAKKAGARKSAKKAKRSGKAGRSAAKRKSPSSSAKKPSAARRSLQRVSIVAKQVAQQAQTAVSGGVDALREIGGNIVDRVGG